MLHDFGSREGSTSGLSEKKPGVAPMWTKTLPAGSKRDLLLLKPEPLSNAGGFSLIAYL